MFCLFGLILYVSVNMIELWHFCLFDLIFYVPVNNFFSYVGAGLPGLNHAVLSKDQCVLLKDTRQ